MKNEGGHKMADIKIEREFQSSFDDFFLFENTEKIEKIEKIQ